MGFWWRDGPYAEMKQVYLSKVMLGSFRAGPRGVISEVSRRLTP